VRILTRALASQLGAAAVAGPLAAAGDTAQQPEQQQDREDKGTLQQPPRAQSGLLLDFSIAHASLLAKEKGFRSSMRGLESAQAFSSQVGGA
jgi:hypothetical protein